MYRNWIRSYLLIGCLLGGAIGGIHRLSAQAKLTIDPDIPHYWTWKGNPTLLIGGSVEDNLFQYPNVESHLDSIQAAGGNYVRNTLSSRDPGNVWAFGKRDSLYDLTTWNPEYWKRLEHFLQLTAEREIIVQLELWATFDFYRDNWEVNPFNPKNNTNYDQARSKLPHHVPTHPIYAENDFFRSVPTQHNLIKVMEYQQKFVDKVLSYTLPHSHILYCMDNETSVPADWGRFWARYIQIKAKEQGKTVHTTEMWDPWDLSHPVHDETLLHPEYYSFVDVSQNNHNSDQEHWDNGMKYLKRMEVLGVKRPVNNVKIYGAGARFGTIQDGVERFWRSAFMGMAAVRFHRPPSGNGFSPVAQSHMRSLRMLFDEIPFYECEPRQDLLSDREEDEAYCLVKAGEVYTVYFPEGGEVTLDFLGFNGEVKVRWLDIAKSSWGSPIQYRSVDSISLRTPEEGHFVALVEIKE